ncbi:MAG TPA: hypothetical protein VN968_21960 [Bradyrhizobium sp.]|jgi:hypothetical protein|nr:hypothetical protein [Bradyrhizobium sp.]
MKSSDLDQDVVETAYARWAPIYDANNDAILVERCKVARFGVYTLVCFERGIPSAV